jgi:hypothetical protein
MLRIVFFGDLLSDVGGAAIVAKLVVLVVYRPTAARRADMQALDYHIAARVLFRGFYI